MMASMRFLSFACIAQVSVAIDHPVQPPELMSSVGASGHVKTVVRRAGIPRTYAVRQQAESMVLTAHATEPQLDGAKHRLKLQDVDNSLVEFAKTRRINDLECKSWCATSATSWTNKCTWTATCAGCSDCAIAETPTESPTNAPSSYFVDCTDGDNANAGSVSSPLQSLAGILLSTLTGRSGITINFKRGCVFDTDAWTQAGTDYFTSITALTLTSYGSESAALPVLSGSHMLSADGNAWGIGFKGCSNLSVSNIEFRECAVYVAPLWQKTLTGVVFQDVVFTDSPQKALLLSNAGTDHQDFFFEDVLIQRCNFSAFKDHAFVLASWHSPSYDPAGPWSKRVTVRDSFFYDGNSDQAAGIVVNSATDILIENNFFTRLRGSGYWSVRTDRSVVRNNFVSLCRRITDSFTGHVDIYNKDMEFYGNIGYRNEGGFFEILGYSNTSIMKYSLSINDGEDLGSARAHDGAIMWASDYSGPGDDPKVAPNFIYMLNNLILSDLAHEMRYGFKGSPSSILFANNIFYAPHGVSTKVDTNDDTGLRTLENNMFVGPAAQGALTNLQQVFALSQNNTVVPDIDFAATLVTLKDYLENEVIADSSPSSTSQSIAQIRLRICSILGTNDASGTPGAYTRAVAASSAITPVAFPGDSFPTHTNTMTADEASGSVGDFCSYAPHE